MASSGFCMQPPSSSSSAKHERICEPSSSKQRQATPNDTAIVSKPSSSTKRSRGADQGKESRPSSKKNKNADKFEGKENAVSEGSKQGGLKEKENTEKRTKGKEQANKDACTPGNLEEKEKSAPGKVQSGILKKKTEKSAPTGRKIRFNDETDTKGMDTPIVRKIKFEGEPKKACNEEKAKEMVDCNSRGAVTCCNGCVSVTQMIQFFKEHTDMMNTIKDEWRASMFNELKDYAIKIAREVKDDSFNNRAYDKSLFSIDRMLQRASSSQSSSMPPLSNAEKEELEAKWREQKAVEMEAAIKRLALMQEELRMRIEKQRSPGNDKRS